MDFYSSEEYIQKVMQIEGCTRVAALKLIDEFRRIDNQRIHIESRISDSEKVKAYRKDWKARKMCICCGRQDEDTLSGLSRCRRCKDQQAECLRRRKANGTKKQDT